MILYTSSRGIYARKVIIEKCLSAELKRPCASIKPTEHDAYIGWGKKSNSHRMKDEARVNDLPFIRLEDGFIGYIGHPSRIGFRSLFPSLKLRKDQPFSLSLVADKQGIYYDARQGSDIENHVAKELSADELHRSKQLIKRINSSGITKYNSYLHLDAHVGLPSNLLHRLDGDSYILLVDQVAGDLSLSGAMVSESDIDQLIADANKEYPESKIVVRAHPDTLAGKKKGLLFSRRSSLFLRDAIWYSESSHPHALIKHANAVYTLSSQMGFEALILGKSVHCYGMPFYAGWGLTHDAKICDRRKKLAPNGVSLEQLVFGSLIRYPKYYNPILDQRCEVEDVIDLIDAQRHPVKPFSKVILVGLSLWKRAFMRQFCRHLASNIVHSRKLPKSVTADEAIVVWGNQYNDTSNIRVIDLSSNVTLDTGKSPNVLRIEDGFIRSSGLGSDLRRPSSVVIDSGGLYFNAQKPNDLRDLLNNKPLTEHDQSRGEKLCRLLVDADINKYNLHHTKAYQPIVTNRARLLVIGQVDGDASTVTGSAVIESNEALLWAVREANPGAWIIYKPHPDVVAQNREGKISDTCFQQCVDEEVLHATLSELYPHIRELHTITSLTGFEALIRNVKVVTWGQPFYAGWGLTTDMYPAQDRNRFLTLAQLVKIALVDYPIYIDWETGLYATPETMIEKFRSQKADMSKVQSRYQRWWLKLKYLLETLFSFH